MTEESKINIPEQVVNTLRCSFCSEYLSVAPIYLYPDLHKPITTCGRCPTISEQNPVRNVPYESLAGLLTYPCRYKSSGCLEQLSMDKALEHENSCIYRQYFCPHLPLGSCPWQGPFVELFCHYGECHSNSLLHKPSFEVDIVNNYQENFLCSIGENIFLIQTQCDTSEQVLQVFVRYIGVKANAEKYCYLFELSNINIENNIESQSYAVGDDTSMMIDSKNAAKINIKDIIKCLNNPSQIICEVNIFEKCEDKSNETFGKPKILINRLEDKFDSISMCSMSDEKILRKLECPACFEYMIPPIHQCIIGHSLCSSCRPTCSVCPLCKSEIGNTRNFTLEDLAEDINYPCKYADFDCCFTSGHKEIKKHEIECQYGPYDCPLNYIDDCKWKGKLTKIMEHVKKSHEESVLDFEEIHLIFSEDITDGDCRISSIHGSIFRIDYKYQNGFFYWSVQLVGPSEDHIKFSYELDFVDPKTKERTYFKRKCTSLCKEGPFLEGSPVLKVPYELLNNYINQDLLIYRCIIHRN